MTVYNIFPSVCVTAGQSAALWPLRLFLLHGGRQFCRHGGGGAVDAGGGHRHRTEHSRDHSPVGTSRLREQVKDMPSQTLAPK